MTATESAATVIDAPVGQRLVCIRDVARLMSLSVPTIERMNAAGRLPAPRRIGRSNRWDVQELDEWLSRPKPDGGLMDRKQWGPVWQAVVRGRRT